jgi:cell division septal protein FtsQ
MLPNFLEKFKRQKQNILLAVIVFLLVFLSFGAGMIAQFYLTKPPLQIIP